MRLRPDALEWSWLQDGLRLCFALPAGCYATTVLAELGDVTDASVRAP